MCQDQLLLGTKTARPPHPALDGTRVVRDGAEIGSDGPSDGDCSSESGEFDDNGDEDFYPDSQSSSEDEEPLMADRAESEDEDAANVEICLCEQVFSIIQLDECENKFQSPELVDIDFETSLLIIFLLLASIGVQAHGNTLNKNAAAVDFIWLVKWFKGFAEEVGEVVPVHVRM
ncbi:Hypothetical protein PHPALM_20026 [Phytophthora palmivora]|uniref:Uncharacterized protein n=1 Tax=Phytophthora palmivora TaxID=4796 RepID=A0A2P4XFX0_9STRA|nr:Hypothetical protein PHPALM_20026 [Phytophthora palmivora]